jgi:hypothetical protein
MPDPDTTPSDPPAVPAGEELVLAALERAARHRARDTPAVPFWSILEHLAIPKRSVAARGVHLQLEALEASGCVIRSRRRSVPTWQPSDAGHRRLRWARAAGRDPWLPESPQHRAWRNARTAAAQEIERFRAGVRGSLEDAARALDARQPPHSDTWLELGENLQRACRRVGSASHCLYEWVEPTDARADIDEHVEATDEALDQSERTRRRARRAGRRNIGLWGEPREP